MNTILTDIHNLLTYKTANPHCIIIKKRCYVNVDSAKSRFKYINT